MTIKLSVIDKFFLADIANVHISMYSLALPVELKALIVCCRSLARRPHLHLNLSWVSLHRTERLFIDLFAVNPS